MPKLFIRVTTLVLAAMSLSAALASTSSATTWHSNKGVSGYSGTFTATSGAFTLTGPTAALSCTGSTLSGTLTAASFSGTPWTNAMTGTLTASGCTVGGQTIVISCSFAMTAQSYAGPVPYPALSGVTSGVANVNCSVFKLGQEVCRITMTNMPASYTNPSTVGGNDGKLTFPAVPRSSGVITIANGSQGVCPVGVGAAALTAITEGLTGSAVFVPIMYPTNP